jgi:hypothetical protein
MATKVNTIVRQGDLGTRHEEKRANAALSPGHLLELMSTGKVRKNTIVAGIPPIWVAKEDGLQGKRAIDAYAADDVVMIHQAQATDLINVRVAAAAAAIVVGDRLEFVSGGTVQKLAAGVARFVAEEAVDNSAGAEEVFIEARVI